MMKSYMVGVAILVGPGCSSDFQGSMSGPAYPLSLSNSFVPGILPCSGRIIARANENKGLRIRLHCADGATEFGIDFSPEDTVAFFTGTGVPTDGSFGFRYLDRSGNIATRVAALNATKLEGGFAVAGELGSLVVLNGEPIRSDNSSGDLRIVGPWELTCVGTESDCDAMAQDLNLPANYPELLRER